MATRRFKAMIDIKGALGSSFKKAFSGARKDIGGVAAEIRKLERRRGTISKMAMNMEKAGMATSRLRRENERLGGSIDKLRSKYARLNTAQSLQAKGKAGLGKTRGRIAGIAGAALPLIGTATSAINFEDALTDVEKNVKGIEDFGGIKKLREEIIKLSKDSQLSASEVAKLVSDAGKIGLQAKEALEYAKIVEKLSIAFEISADESGELFNSIKSGMGLTIPEMDKLGDAINFLGDNTASNAKRISSVLQRSGSVLASTTSLATAEIAALAAAIDEASPNAEMSATAMKNFSLALTRGAGASSAQKDTLQDLGFSAQQMAERMQTDAKGAIMDVLAAIGDLDQAAKAGAIETLFGRESLSGIAPLIADSTKLANIFGLVSDDANFLGSALDEYIRKSGTTLAKLKTLAGQYGNLAIVVGTELLPAIKTGAQWLGKIANGLTNWANENPRTARTIGFITLGALGLAAALTVVGGVIAAAKVALGALVAAGLPVIGIVAAIGVAAAVIIANWSDLKQFFTTLWNDPLKGIKQFAGFVWKFFKWSPMGLMMQTWGKAFEWITRKISFIGSTIGKIRNLFGGGESSEAQETTSGRPSTPRAAAAVRRGRSANRAPTTINNSPQITVNAAAGQSAEALADEVMWRLQQQQSAATAGALFD